MAGTRWGALVILAVSCSPGAPLALPVGTPETGEAFGGVQCNAVRPQTEPDLMGWDSGSRANMRSLSRRGIVAVRYQAAGCDVQLEVLSNCIGGGTYEEEPYTANDSKMARDAQELFTELPLGAAKLSGKLTGDRALRTDYALAGMLVLPPGQAFERTQLKGAGCERATHVVSRIYIGGFAMVAGETKALEASASVFGAALGGKSSAGAERLANEGIAKACTEAQETGKPSAQCSVPLRIGLLELGKTSAMCPKGTSLVDGQCVRQASCPEDTEWDGSACVRKRVVTNTECPEGSSYNGSKCVRSKVDCPPGTTLNGDRCVATVSRDCPGGTRFESGRGCVAVVVAAPTPRPAPRAQPASLPPPAPGSGSCPSGMASIAGGSFMMGSNDGRAVEKPVHSVALSSFCMDVTEVTVAAYRGCVQAGRCATPATGRSNNWGVAGRDQHPINGVSWTDATTFCGWANKRLPTESEWEYAARGREGRTYPWGSAAPTCTYAVMSEGGVGCGRKSTWPVGSKPAGRTPEGLSDMSGNVWEWTSDTYCPYPGKTCSETARVYRGGGWFLVFPSYLRGASRGSVAPSRRYDHIGFRCAR